MNNNTSSQPVSDEARHLGLVPLFCRLDERELVKLAEEVDQLRFQSGETIFHEYDQGDALYVLETGVARSD